MDLVDLVLAILHHILVFSLAAILAAETVLVNQALAGDTLRRLARIDAFYGATAGLVLIVGIGRVLFGLKGWEFYVANHAFWGKMVCFAIVGLLSIVPTRHFLKWRSLSAGDKDFRVPDAEARSMRIYLRMEGVFFLGILIFAAAMARGYGA
jgi:putative membrane protein